ncbi:hypothetical protein AURDEDRAFT_150300 [Auricularia subglabra TFB-10046 SS5]|nr:hypothetical protein AURDEDRAFT_150300 [Auricularia subglabra TFB-10046 SS5]
MTLAPPRSPVPPDRDGAGTPSGINVVALAATVPTLVDLVVSHTLRLWERARTDIMLYRAHKRSIFSQTDSVPMHLFKEVSHSLPNALNELLAHALGALAAALEHTLRITARTEDPLWSLLVGRSALERALANVDAAHAYVVRCAQCTLLLGPPVVAAKAASPGVAASKPLQRAIAMREAVANRAADAPSSFKLLLSGQDVPSGPRTRLHFHSDIYTVAEDIVEYRSYDPSDHSSLRRVRDQAALLAAAHHSTGLLSARGFVPRPEHHKCELLIPIPRGLAHPFTLRAALLDKRNADGVRHPLAERLMLARRLVRAVLFAHACGVPHGDVRPENVVLLFPRGSDGAADDKLLFPWSLGTGFLLGLDFPVPEDNDAMRGREGEWWADVYRHPSRHGRQPYAALSLLHDVYSLGVVLLEIALWRSLITIEERPAETQTLSVVSPSDGQPLSRANTTGATSPAAADAKQVLRANTTPTSAYRPRLKYRPNRAAVSLVDREGRMKDGEDVHKALVRKAVEYIPLVLGERYRDAVLVCLNCLDGAFGKDRDMERLEGREVEMAVAVLMRVGSMLDEIQL